VKGSGRRLSANERKNFESKKVKESVMYNNKKGYKRFVKPLNFYFEQYWTWQVVDNILVENLCS
jgi:hypothetical protein